MKNYIILYSLILSLSINLYANSITDKLLKPIKRNVNTLMAYLPNGDESPDSPVDGLYVTPSDNNSPVYIPIPEDSNTIPMETPTKETVDPAPVPKEPMNRRPSAQEIYEENSSVRKYLISNIHPPGIPLYPANTPPLNTKPVSENPKPGKWMAPHMEYLNPKHQNNIPIIPIEKEKPFQPNNEPDSKAINKTDKLIANNIEILPPNIYIESDNDSIPKPIIPNEPEKEEEKVDPPAPPVDDRDTGIIKEETKEEEKPVHRTYFLSEDDFKSPPRTEKSSSIPKPVEPYNKTEKTPLIKPPVIKPDKETKINKSQDINLPKGYYIQVASLKSNRLANRVIRKLKSEYSISVLETYVKNQKFYRCLIGPISSNKVGRTLNNLKSKGYKDAFVWHRK